MLLRVGSPGGPQWAPLSVGATNCSDSHTFLMASAVPITRETRHPLEALLPRHVTPGRGVSYLVPQRVSHICAVPGVWDGVSMTATLGYARVSTVGQDLDAQRVALHAVGVDDPQRLFTA